MNKSFASDNFSGVHGKVLMDLNINNQGHVSGYGTDDLTLEVEKLIINTLGATSCFLMLNGTGTNITLLDYLTDNHGAVICSEHAHILTHESGAASKVGNFTLLPVASEDGKITIEGMEKYMSYREDYHCPCPQVISITQPTEMGAVYSLEELEAITTYAHDHGLKVHMDGARISNSAVALGVSLKEMTGDIGIDALSFGMCKNGMMFGEAAVFFNQLDSKHFNYTRKQNLQLQSKMRYIASQYKSMLTGELWKECATIANEVAVYLEEELEKCPGVSILHEAQANILFVRFPKEKIQKLQDFMYFYLNGDDDTVGRLVTSFDSTVEEVDAFVALIKE